MSHGRDRGARDDDARLAEIVEVVVGIASNDFTRRADVGDGLDLLDGLATAVNMMAEEVAQQHAREQAFHQRIVQSERLAAIGQLAAGVAHEVNNPAASTLANLTVLESLLQHEAREGDVGRAAALTQAIDITRDCARGVERIVAIVRDLRNFARMDAAPNESIAPNSLVDEACQLVRAELAYRATLVVHRGTPPQVSGDRTKLVQVLTNLLFNAAQAIPEGESARHQVTVSTSGRDGCAVITVSDSGRGIDPSVQSRIFDPFFTTKPRDAGLGLGLSISADIARRHGGELTLVGSSPSGTTFELSLPAGVEAAASAPPSPQPRSAVPPSVDPKPRLLLIDDEEGLLAAWRRVFSNRYDVTTVGDGQAAIALMEEGGRWDAILCDLMMPGVDGAAVFEWVSANRPDMIDRMLFSSGGAFTPRGMAFCELMGERILHKPVRPDVLRAAIERVRLQ